LLRRNSARVYAFLGLSEVSFFLIKALIGRTIHSIGSTKLRLVLANTVLRKQLSTVWLLLPTLIMSVHTITLGLHHVSRTLVGVLILDFLYLLSLVTISEPIMEIVSEFFKNVHVISNCGSSHISRVLRIWSLLSCLVL